MQQDIAVATGRFDGDSMSLECAGIVQKVGKEVSELKPGDKVWGYAPGCFGNFVRTRASALQHMDDCYSFAEMASIPIAYSTAVYALLNVGQLRRGESVLIQSALGGLGMAGMKIAHNVGAEIYATVGTAEKIEILVQQFGISRTRVFRTHDISTPSLILQATQQKGIDVILSSVAGDQMQEYWRCIAQLGRFIEVGRLDVHNSGKLSMEVFKRNATFASFDISLLFDQNPEVGQR